MLGNLRSDADGSGLLELQEILDSWQALQREGRNPNAPSEARRVKQVWAVRTLGVELSCGHFSQPSRFFARFDRLAATLWFKKPSLEDSKKKECPRNNSLEQQPTARS